MTANVDFRLPDEGLGSVLNFTGYSLATPVHNVTEVVRALSSVWVGLTPHAHPIGLAARGLRWLTTMIDRSHPRWHLPNEIVFTTPFARLRDFTDPAEGDRDVVPTLVLPPQAGHSSTVIDFSPAQSQLAVIRDAGLSRLFALEWRSATATTRHISIDDYLSLIDRSIDHLGGRANIVGVCQGGWLAAIYAALHPDRVHTLTLAGAPIDFHAGKSVVAATTKAVANSFGMAPYRALVAAGGGNLPGEAVLGNFIAIQPHTELTRHLQLLEHLDDHAHVERYRVFEDWFKHTQDIPGAFYLWLIEHLFWGNELIDGRLTVDGRRVDLSAIDCPLFVLAGARDHITPAEQVFAVADAVGTPKQDIVCRLADAGHLGLFMGRAALRTDWIPLMTAVAARSGQAQSVC